MKKIAKNLSNKKMFEFPAPPPPPRPIKIRILMRRWPSMYFLLGAGHSGERDGDQLVLELGGQGVCKAVALGL